VLWRFHRVHHADLDMNASTGLRFHFGEILISVLFRTAQVLVFGISRRALSIWSTLLLVEVMFHHSNIGLPRAIERWLSKLVVTPRLHGIHHSLEPDEVNSNWSSGLTIWDWLHGTFRKHARQDDAMLDIGVPELREPRQVRFSQLITLPLTADRVLPPVTIERSESKGHQMRRTINFCRMILTIASRPTTRTHRTGAIPRQPTDTTSSSSVVALPGS